MRLRDKKNILELIEIIEEGILCIKNQENGQRIFMLNECKAAFVYLYKKFECENRAKEKVENILLYIDILINNSDNENFNNIIRNIEENLYQLIYILKNEISTKIEIAFIPYKVSMWDCMESVWKAAIEDENCICRVIPIPYYELDKDMKPKKLCYEGHLFPENINIIDYKSYDFENIEPDIIYIHNPYDNYNRLTMIEPRYFSSNLAKYTDMLVYIPYFVAGSCKDHKDHERLSLLPGPLNSTKIIAQSEVQKKLFILNGHDENKILNLGSPKFDATLYAEKNKNKLLGKAHIDYREKKVFLLSTGITNLLADENWINEINEILNVFINNDESYLIWRVHPLTETTINTMRPNLINAFEKLKSKISKSNNLMMDTNSNVYKSLVASDALISDYSSIMIQYMVTEKPVLGFIDKELIKENRVFAADYRGNYFIENKEDIVNFKKMVLNGMDLKKKERMLRLNNSVSNLDGTCGQKIHCNIIKSAIVKILNH